MIADRCPIQELVDVSPRCIAGDARQAADFPAAVAMPHHGANYLLRLVSQSVHGRISPDGVSLPFQQ